MKQGDLQIGDWVLSFPDQCRVDGIICLREGHTAEEKWMAIVHLGGNKYERVNVGMLEPIPITHEILEKNGFKESYCAHILGSYDGKEIMLDLGTVYLCEDDAPEGWEAIRIKDIQYVHELQHTLKYFNIDKEIVL